MMTDKT